MDKAIELAKQAGAVSYTNRHYPDRPYRTFGPEELQKFYTLARADYETKLSAVMPADLEAENAKLRQALQDMVGTFCWGDMNAGEYGAIEAARAALGETK